MKKSTKAALLEHKSVSVLTEADIAHVCGGEDEGSSGGTNHCGSPPLGIRQNGNHRN